MRGDCGAGSRCNGTESQLITERFSALCADEDEAWRRDVRQRRSRSPPCRNALPNYSFRSSNLFSCRSWHKREAMRCPGRMSSMPHSSASHQSSAVMAEVTSTIGVGISGHLTHSTRSLQLPSGRASCVTITVFSRFDLSKSTAALMLGAHCISSPYASMSCATVASGLVGDTKMTVPARLRVCIDL